VTVYDLMTGGDLMNMPRLNASMQGQDMVFHLAGHATVRLTADQWLPIRSNVICTQNVLDAMRLNGVKRIVFSSTSAVYGDTTVFPTPEDVPFPVQTSLYGASKIAAEALVSAYARSFDMQATIFRFAPVLGEGYHRGHLYDFWRKLKQDPTRIEIQGNGEQRRSYIYVGDVVNALLLAGLDGSSEPVRIFNVGHSQSCTVNESLGWLCESCHIEPERVYTGTSWKGDKALTLLDCTRLMALGWTPQVSIKDAVLRTVASFDG
jgi:UDP-glucose 4-epimerase